MSNISSTLGTTFAAGPFGQKKADLAQGGGDLPAGPFEEDEQRLIHQHKRPTKTANRNPSGRRRTRRLIGL